MWWLINRGEKSSSSHVEILYQIKNCSSGIPRIMPKLWVSSIAEMCVTAFKYVSYD